MVWQAPRTVSVNVATALVVTLTRRLA